MSRILGALGNTTKKSSATKDYFRERAVKKGAKGSGKIDFEELMEKKLDEVKKELRSSNMYKVCLPGTDPNQERPVSAATEAALQRIAEARAKKSKKTKDAVCITPRSFGGAVGGRMNSKGQVFDAQGTIVLTIDKNDGKIRNAKGAVVGKYNPASNYSGFQVEKLLARYSPLAAPTANPFALPEGWGGNGGGGGGGGWAPEAYVHDYNPGSFWGNGE